MIKRKSNTSCVDIVRLCVTLLGIFCFVIPMVFVKLGTALVSILYITGYGLWALLAVEAGLQLIRMGQAQRRQFLKMYKSDLIFCIVTAICLPVSLISGTTVLGVVVAGNLPGALRKFQEEKVFQCIVNIIAVILIILFVFPFMNVIAVSLSAPDQIVNLIPKDIDLFAIKYVLQDEGFFRAVAVSVIVTVVGTALSVTCMAMAAYPLSKKEMPFRRTMMMFFVIVMLFSGGMAPNMLLMNYLGLNNTIWALIFPSVVQVFYLILLKGYFEDVPSELEESAQIDGANNYTILFKIVLPVAAPMVATVAFFTMISYWNNINNAILYITSNQDVYPLPMYIRNFLNRNPMDIALSNPELLRYWDGVKMSYVLFSIIPVLIVYPFTFKYLKNGVAMGAVKG